MRHRTLPEAPMTGCPNRLMTQACRAALLCRRASYADGSTRQGRRAAGAVSVRLGVPKRVHPTPPGGCAGALNRRPPASRGHRIGAGSMDTPSSAALRAISGARWLSGRGLGAILNRNPRAAIADGKSKRRLTNWLALAWPIAQSPVVGAIVRPRNRSATQPEGNGNTEPKSRRRFATRSLQPWFTMQRNRLAILLARVLHQVLGGFAGPDGHRWRPMLRGPEFCSTGWNLA
jgi:hypothetical protein